MTDTTQDRRASSSSPEAGHKANKTSGLKPRSSCGLQSIKGTARSIRRTPLPHRSELTTRPVELQIPLHKYDWPLRTSFTRAQETARYRDRSRLVGHSSNYLYGSGDCLAGPLDRAVTAREVGCSGR